MFDDLEKYKSVIGLEVRVQHPTNSHLFFVDSTPFGNLPNHNECIVSPDFTGSSLILNKQIIEDVIKQHLSIQLKNFKQFPFDRENYFYTDISKGYQILWDKTPICLGVFIKVKRKNG